MMTVRHRPPWAQHDSRAPLAVAPPHLERQLGVLATNPFHHHGLHAVRVDVSRETVAINTTVHGNSYPAEETQHRVRSAIEATIADLNEVITELTAHRDRLLIELAEATSRDDWITTTSEDSP